MVPSHPSFLANTRFGRRRDDVSALTMESAVCVNYDRAVRSIDMADFTAHNNPTVIVVNRVKKKKYLCINLGVP